MKLGYLMIPQQRSFSQQPPKICRAKFARTQNFSEFYVAQPAHPSVTSGLYIGSPEQASLLHVSPDLPRQPAPQVIAIDGERQSLGDQMASPKMAVPSETTAHIKANLAKRRASLSVSWLSKSELAQHWAAHVTASTHAGVRARTENWRVARTILICDDPAKAEAAVKSRTSPCRAYYTKLANARGIDVDALIDACVVRGTLQSVLDHLQEFAATVGPFGTLTLVDHAWPDTQMAERSIASLVSAIAPVFQQSRLAI